MMLQRVIKAGSTLSLSTTAQLLTKAKRCLSFPRKHNLHLRGNLRMLAVMDCTQMHNRHHPTHVVPRPMPALQPTTGGAHTLRCLGAQVVRMYARRMCRVVHHCRNRHALSKIMLARGYLSSRTHQKTKAKLRDTHCPQLVLPGRRCL